MNKRAKQIRRKRHRRGKPMTREQQKAMFASKAEAAYAILSAKQHESLRKLAFTQGMPTDTQGMGLLVKRLRTHWATTTQHGTAGTGPWRADLNRKINPAGWEYTGEGVGRVVISDPAAGLTLKFNKPIRPFAGLKIRETRQTIREAKNIKRINAAKEILTVRLSGGDKVTLHAPKLFKVSPSGKYALVEHIPGQDYNPPRRLQRVTGKMLRISDTHSGNLRRVGDKVYLIDLGYSKQTGSKKSAYSYRLHTPTTSARIKTAPSVKGTKGTR